MKERTDFAKQISRFLTTYLPYERSVSNNTIKSYSETFTQFVMYMRDCKSVKVEKLSLKHFTKDNILDFLSWIISSRNCGNATRNYRLSAFCSFAKYLQYKEVGGIEVWQAIMSIPKLKTGEKPVEYLSVDAVKLLLAQPDVSTCRGRRDLALLSLMCDTGARVQEICDLIPMSLRIESEPFSIYVIGKGKRGRTIPLLKEQVESLRIYMKENFLFSPEKLQHPLFYNCRHEKLTRAGVTYILDKYVDKARKENPAFFTGHISCHTLRHTKAMHLLQAGVILHHIRDILGHSSVMTTEIYARSDSKQKREAIERAYLRLSPNIESENLWEKDKGLLEELMSFR